MAIHIKLKPLAIGTWQLANTFTAFGTCQCQLLIADCQQLLAATECAEP
jgi:hypothetical protein